MTMQEQLDHYTKLVESVPVWIREGTARYVEATTSHAIVEEDCNGNAWVLPPQ